jgi:hypothetical protein
MTEKYLVVAIIALSGLFVLIEHITLIGLATRIQKKDAEESVIGIKRGEQGEWVVVEVVEEKGREREREREIIIQTLTLIRS